MVIISLLGLSVYDTKYPYKDNDKTNFKLQDGEFVNSIDVLLHSFEDKTKFVFFGTDKSIKTHEDFPKFKDLFQQKNVELIEYKNGDLNDIFAKMISKIATIEDEILFDITHSFRDAVIMSVLSTIIAQIVYKPKITMIYAKEYKDKDNKSYTYELVSDDILNTSNIALVLSTFIQTLKIPSLQSKYELYEKLNDFSIHLLSNQFKAIYEEDIDKLKQFIKDSKERLFFVKNLVEQLEKIIVTIEQTKNKPTYEKFLFFTEFFYQKDYYLHSATYLIEGVTQYIGIALQEQNMINFDMDEYDNQQKIVALLKLNYNQNDFNFPHEYFVDINIDIFNRLLSLRDNIGKIRHNLAHINVSQDYKEIKTDLGDLIDEYKEIVQNNVLYKMDKTLDKKKSTVKYRLQHHENNIRTFAKTKESNNIPKFNKVLEKYEERKLDDLTMMDISKVKNYLSKNYSEIKQLMKKRKNRQLFLDEADNNKQNIKTMPNGEKRVVKDLRKKRKITQTQLDKKILKEGATKLSERFSNR